VYTPIEGGGETATTYRSKRSAEGALVQWAVGS
jgi:hypothetical protein